MKLIKQKYMIKFLKNNYFLFNTFFKKIHCRKKYVKKLKNKSSILFKIWKQQIFQKRLQNKFFIKKEFFFITYIIKICFLKTNTLIQIVNAFGSLKFFCSAGKFLFKGKNKRSRTSVLKKVIYFLFTKLKFLKHRPIGLFLESVQFKKTLIIEKFRKKIFLKTVIGLNPYSHNGCRKKKALKK